jgi:hypothetical protein
MKTNMYKKQRVEDTAEDPGRTERDAPLTISYNEPLSRAAYDWNHALEIAADKFWGDQAPLLRIVPRK